jgi:hypothetical protein
MTLDPLSALPMASIKNERSVQASKWMHIRVLLDVSELQELLTHSAPCFLVNIASVCGKDQMLTTPEQLIKIYADYIVALQQGGRQHIQSYKKQLCCALSRTLDPFYLIQLQVEKFLVKLKTPAIRMQQFHFHYIADQDDFLTTYNLDHSISWGLELSFPQFYQDPETCLPVEIFKDVIHPNTQLFKAMQKWMRDHTLPVPFLIEGQKKVAPFRIGKKCFEWINLYPSLSNKGLKIYEHRSHHHRE